MVPIYHYYFGINCIIVTKPKMVKLGFQDFWAGHFSGHLFLSIFKNLGRLYYTFYQFLNKSNRVLKE